MAELAWLGLVFFPLDLFPLVSDPSLRMAHAIAFVFFCPWLASLAPLFSPDLDWLF